MASSDASLAEQIGDWLIDQALGDPEIGEMFEALCQKVSGIGVPIGRAWLGWTTLHPLFRAESAVWLRNGEMTLGHFPHNSDTAAWRRSPNAHMIEHGLDVLRRRLHGAGAMLDFDVTRELAEKGFTDYLALGTSFTLHGGARSDIGGSGVFVSWACDQPDGFRDEDLAALQQLQRPLATACKTAIDARVTRNVAKTYLGPRAGESVLSGSIHLGDGEEIDAIVWFSDLRGSTRLAETLPSGEFVELLNTYFLIAAAPAMHAGGEILAFIGDAVLAIFPLADHSDREALTARVLAALDEAQEKAGEIGRERAKNGLDPIRFGIAINRGSVMFGNIGVPERLAFSVIGPTVIEVARIEKLTKRIGEPILATREIADLAPERWQPAGTHPLEGSSYDADLFSFIGSAGKPKTRKRASAKA